MDEKRTHLITAAMLAELDHLYDETADRGVLGLRPVHWGELVQKLRGIRHLVEAGVIVKIEGTVTCLTDWSSFYGWAHGRYHSLEDGYDQWIGDDR